MPQGPGTYDPFRHKDRALARRNIVLKAMLENGFIKQKEYDEPAKLCRHHCADTTGAADIRVEARPC